MILPSRMTPSLPISAPSRSLYPKLNTAKAQQQADTLLKEAQKEIQRERQQTLDGVQGEIADLALAAAAHLMEQKVDDQTNRDLVDAFLSEEGAEK